MPTYTENISGSEVRALTGVSSTVASDEIVGQLLPYAAAQLNNDIQVRHDDWRVVSIDEWRENKLDGSNRTFYVPRFPIGDYFDVGVISGGAVKAYKIEDGGTDSAYKRTNLVVESILDSKQGKIQLEQAPGSGDSLFLSWSEVPLELETPRFLIKKAIAELVAAMAATRVNANQVSKFRIGKVSKVSPSDASRAHMSSYERTRFQILSKVVKRKDFKSLFTGFEGREFVFIGGKSVPVG